MDKRYTYKPISSVKLMSKMYSVNNNVEVRNNNNIRCLMTLVLIKGTSD